MPLRDGVSLLFGSTKVDSRKRARSPSPTAAAAADEFDDGLDDAALALACVDDTHAAVLMLLRRALDAHAVARIDAARSKRPAPPAGVPWVLEHALYATVRDRSVVDARLTALCRDGTLVRLRVNTGRDVDVAAVLFADYAAAAKAALGGATPAAARFLGAVRRVASRGRVTGEQLLGDGAAADPGGGGGRGGGGALDAAVDELMAAGLLRPRHDVQRGASPEWWLAHPSGGAYVRALTAGRSDLLSVLKRTRYKEELRAVLARRRLRGTHLGAAFHVADLVGLGEVTVVATPAGEVIRLRREAKPAGGAS